MQLSIIIPCFNEEGNIKILQKTIKETLKKIKYEIIFINDGSTDETEKILDKIYKKNNNIKIIHFSRNFGKDAAIYAGLKNAEGEYITIIDADMQQHPKYILEMFKFLNNNKNYDQVAMKIKKRKKGILHKIGGNLFYKIINKLSDIHFEKNASDFRMFRSYVKKAILNLPEKNRFSKGIFNWIGFKTKYLEYDVQKRLTGKSKFNLKKSIKYAIEGILCYTTKPLKIAMIIGIICSIISIIILIYTTIKIITTNIISKFLIIICLILLIGGIQLICIGILGEYLSKAYIEVKNRPIYVSRKEQGIKEEKKC